MKTDYKAPQVEVIEIELENILCASGGDGDTSGSTSDFLDDGGAN